MKFRHSIHGLYEVSFKTVEQINPNTNAPSGVKLDNWQEIQAASAIALEELLGRIEKLEAALGKVYSETSVVNLLEKAAKVQEKEEDEPRPRPPRGVPLEKVLEGPKKGGRPKKAP